MDNKETMAILVARRDAINAAIAALSRYRTEADNWKAAVKSAQMDTVKSDANGAGVDISTWDGTEPAS